MNFYPFQEQLNVNGEIDSDEIVCPNCFYGYQDSWEFSLDDGDDTVIECAECNKEFKVTCHKTVSYVSKKRR